MEKELETEAEQYFPTVPTRSCRRKWEKAEVKKKKDSREGSYVIISLTVVLCLVMSCTDREGKREREREGVREREREGGGGREGE